MHNNSCFPSNSATAGFLFLFTVISWKQIHNTEKLASAGREQDGGGPWPSVGYCFVTIPSGICANFFFTTIILRLVQKDETNNAGEVKEPHGSQVHVVEIYLAISLRIFSSLTDIVLGRTWGFSSCNWQRGGIVLASEMGTPPTISGGFAAERPNYRTELCDITLFGGSLSCIGHSWPAESKCVPFFRYYFLICFHFRNRTNNAES
mgnify:CR=1 FL=1